MLKPLLLLDGMIFGVIGMMFLGAPGRWAKTLGISLTTPGATTDLRATYGGMDLMLGVFFILCAGKEGWQEAGLACATLVFLGLLAARAMGVVLNGADRLMAQLLAAEVVLVTLNGVGLFLLVGNAL